MKYWLGVGAVVIIGCAASKGYNACDEMRKTGREIDSLQDQNRTLKEQMDAVPEGTDSTASKRFSFNQLMEKNNEKINYLKNYNQTNATNCAPAGKEPEPPARSGY